jgi:hypothetical protein
VISREKEPEVVPRKSKTLTQRKDEIPYDRDLGDRKIRRQGNGKEKPRKLGKKRDVGC